jgi:predicted nuclease with RNAse H fold
MKKKLQDASPRQTLSISAAAQKTLLGAFHAQLERLNLSLGFAASATGFSRSAFESWRNNKRRMRKRNARVIRIATDIMKGLKRRDLNFIDLKYAIKSLVRSEKD